MIDCQASKIRTIVTHGFFGILFLLMIIIKEDQWDEIKENLLSSVDYEFSHEPLVYFHHKTNESEEIGTRETYEFTKNNMDFMIILDKEKRLTKTTSEKDGKVKEHFQRSPDEYTYKLTIQYRSQDGSWKDSSSLESSFGQ